jgi:eukaryotic-like serine/threonine-protein kinase
LYRSTAQRSPAASPSTAADVPFRNFEISQLTSSGTAVSPAISPDGRYVVYAQQDGQSSTLWVRQVATSSNVKVVDNEPGRFLTAPTVTPDSNFVDYLVLRTGPGFEPELWRVPFLGGAPKRVAANVWSPLGWSPDGTRMAFIRQDVAANTAELIVADADGGNERVLVKRERPRMFVSIFFVGAIARPVWSPDGRVIAVFGADVNSQRTEVVFVDAATGKETICDPGGTWVPQGLAWLGPNDVVLSQPKKIGRGNQLWRMSYPDGAVSPFTNDLSSYVGVDVTSDRRSAVTSRSDTRVAVWVGDAAGSQGTDVTPAFQSEALIMQLVWAGERLLYGTTVNGVPSVAGVTPGSAPVDLVTNAALPAVTSDGRTVVFLNTNEDALGLWKVDATSGARPVTLEKGNALWPIVTPDDRSVVFMSTRSGLQTPWMVPIDGGEAKQIVDAFVGVGTMDVSRDGRRLVFYTSDPENRFKLVVCDLPTCANRISLDPPLNYAYGTLRFTPDGQAIAYFSGSNIWSQPIKGGPLRQITHFDDSRQIVNFAWSRDGKRLAVARATVTNDVVLLKAKTD